MQHAVFGGPFNFGGTAGSAAFGGRVTATIDCRRGRVAAVQKTCHGVPITAAPRRSKRPNPRWRRPIPGARTQRRAGRETDPARAKRSPVKQAGPDRRHTGLAPCTPHPTDRFRTPLARRSTATTRRAPSRRDATGAAARRVMPPTATGSAAAARGAQTSPLAGATPNARDRVGLPDAAWMRERRRQTAIAVAGCPVLLAWAIFEDAHEASLRPPGQHLRRPRAGTAVPASPPAAPA